MKKLDCFSQWTPIDLKKSEDGEDYVKVEGIASTESVDESGEIILQDGLDFSYALKRGFLNLEHKAGPKYVLGHPTEFFKTSHNGKKATGLRGVLYTKKQNVRDIMETADAMKAAGNTRQLGFSIEGSVLERDKRNPRIIKRAKVLNVSITSSPCNADATMKIVKSIMNEKDYQQEETIEMKKDNEYSDVAMSKKQCKILQGYSEKMCKLLEMMPEEYDMPEWVQSKITKAQDYMQVAYHYMEVERAEKMEEMKSYKSRYEEVKAELDKFLQDKEMPKPSEGDIQQEGPGIHPTMEEDDDYTTNDKPYGVKVVEKIVDDNVIMADAAEEGGSVAPISRESLEDEVASADFDMSDEEMKELVMRILREYPQIGNDKIMEVIHQIIARKMYNKMCDDK